MSVFTEWKSDHLNRFNHILTREYSLLKLTFWPVEENTTGPQQIIKNRFLFSVEAKYLYYISVFISFIIYLFISNE